MTIQPLLRPTPPRSRFVTVLSWLTIGSGASLVFSSGSALLMDRASFSTVAALVGGLAGGIAGAGLNQREEWARRGFIYVQAYGIAAALFDIATHPVRAAGVVALVAVFALNGWIIAKLRSPRVRAEFEESD